MNKLLSEHLNKYFIPIKNAVIPLFLGGIIVFLVSCSSDIEKVKLMTEEETIPDQSLQDADIIYSKSGKMEVKVEAPVIQNFESVEEPHMTFPQGINVELYDSTLTVESKISANYAIYHKTDKWWEAKNNVVAINNEGDTLNTEYLIWNQEEEVIFTDRYVRITTRDGIIHGKGFEANQDFSNWRIKETTGTIEVKDE
jgi:LPS export ABC transporter protein LptC